MRILRVLLELWRTIRKAKFEFHLLNQWDAELFEQMIKEYMEI